VLPLIAIREKNTKIYERQATTPQATIVVTKQQHRPPACQLLLLNAWLL